MVIQLGSGWTVELERGPDWLFVQLRGSASVDAADARLAERIWGLLEQGMEHRLVLEMGAVDHLTVEMMEDVAALYDRVTSRGGVMRMCGLSDDDYAVVERCGLTDRFPHYETRAEAVLGCRPNKPR